LRNRSALSASSRRSRRANGETGSAAPSAPPETGPLVSRWPTPPTRTPRPPERPCPSTDAAASLERQMPARTMLRACGQENIPTISWRVPGAPSRRPAPQRSLSHVEWSGASCSNPRLRLLSRRRASTWKALATRLAGSPAESWPNTSSQASWAAIHQAGYAACSPKRVPVVIQMRAANPQQRRRRFIEVAGCSTSARITG